MNILILTKGITSLGTSVSTPPLTFFIFPLVESESAFYVD